MYSIEPSSQSLLFASLDLNASGLIPLVQLHTRERKQNSSSLTPSAPVQKGHMLRRHIPVSPPTAAFFLLLDLGPMTWDVCKIFIIRPGRVGVDQGSSKEGTESHVSAGLR
jgi:hypothetical protein